MLILVSSFWKWIIPKIIDTIKETWNHFVWLSLQKSTPINLNNEITCGYCKTFTNPKVSWGQGVNDLHVLLKTLYLIYTCTYKFENRVMHGQFDPNKIFKFEGQDGKNLISMQFWMEFFSVKKMSKKNFHLQMLQSPTSHESGG